MDFLVFVDLLTQWEHCWFTLPSACHNSICGPCWPRTLTIRSAFYPAYISVVNLLQSLHYEGALNSKRRKFFWAVVRPYFRNFRRPPAWVNAEPFSLPPFSSGSGFLNMRSLSWLQFLSFASLITGATILFAIYSELGQATRDWVYFPSALRGPWLLKALRLYGLSKLVRFYLSDAALTQFLELSEINSFSKETKFLQKIWILIFSRSWNGNWVRPSYWRILRKRLQWTRYRIHVYCPFWLGRKELQPKRRYHSRPQTRSRSLGDCRTASIYDDLRLISAIL